MSSQLHRSKKHVVCLIAGLAGLGLSFLAGSADLTAILAVASVVVTGCVNAIGIAMVDAAETKK